MKNPSERESPSCLLSVVERSGRVESRHHGAVVVVGREGVVHAWGDTDTQVYTRSAIKPLQALPLLERGVAKRLDLGAPELAVMCASHQGTPEHVEVVRGFLARGDFSEDDLLCGPHAPFDKRASLDIARAGGKPQRIHNNCSGKHTGFLHLAADMGVAPESYLDPESASQQLIRRTVGEMAGVDEADIELGVDGCGAPTLHLPLVALATAFFRLANPDGLPDVRAAACRRIFDAANREPVLLAGHGRLCTALIRSAPGQLITKNGAEGVYAAGTANGYGVAIKVSDGAERGYTPVVVDLLQRLGIWSEVPAELADFAAVPVRNTRKALVGHVRSVLA